MKAGESAAEPDMIIDGDIKTASRMPEQAIGNDFDNFDC
jgi:hypothetical protein